MSLCNTAPPKYSYDSGYRSAAFVQSNAKYVGTYIGDRQTPEIPFLSFPVRPDLELHPTNSLASFWGDYDLGQGWDRAYIKGFNFDVGDKWDLNASNRNLLPLGGSGRSSFQPLLAYLTILSWFRYTIYD
jgi:hypothetical protein